MELKVVVVLLLVNAVTVKSSFFEVRYPSVAVTAETHGNLTIAAGPDGGNIFINAGEGGTIFIGHTDILQLFEIFNSMPPIWGQKAPFGSLGTFQGGDYVLIHLTALDPEGTHLRFSKISGAMPPGIFLDSKTGIMNGTAPDVDATYEFGIRVTDEHGKYADQTFTIDTREQDQCKCSPCQNGGTCIDDYETFKCTCTQGYGEKMCNIYCQNHAVGISVKLRTIPDAQMAGHYSYTSSDHRAYEGRLDSATGWIGEDSNSWLQIDLGNVRNVQAIATQGFSASYSLSTFYLECSVNGNTFPRVPALNGTAQIFSGSGSTYAATTKQVLPVPQLCQYIRFRPISWTGAHPGFRVEVYACEL